VEDIELRSTGLRLRQRFNEVEPATIAPWLVAPPNQRRAGQGRYSEPSRRTI
jgi:hypothetical protein